MFSKVWENDREKSKKVPVHLSLKNLNSSFNPSQNVFPILLLNGLMIITNEALTAFKCPK